MIRILKVRGDPIDRSSFVPVDTRTDLPDPLAGQHDEQIGLSADRVAHHLRDVVPSLSRRVAVVHTCSGPLVFDEDSRLLRETFLDGSREIL